MKIIADYVVAAQLYLAINYDGLFPHRVVNSFERNTSTQVMRSGPHRYYKVLCNNFRVEVQ